MYAIYSATEARKATVLKKFFVKTLMYKKFYWRVF